MKISVDHLLDLTNPKSNIMAKYSKKAGDKVQRAMHEEKRGQLKSGRSGKKVTSRKQAIAIGLSEARAEGARVPSKKSSKSAGRQAAPKKAASKKTAGKKAAPKKAASKKTASKKAATKKTASKKTASKKTAGKKTASKKSGGRSATRRK